ncbi:hypothetical protein RclHR1_00850015 [Rhizophagus clarus]|uniref:AAA+ ATPase domain-containing protein n=1 Tax=Rhizophagus clarus TaxID=94130 RepID=A0A2Z6S182_9GLOM|nr:hypothetical protein RclHR1_00850015 [Rhizophagus clarus]
MLQPPNDYSSYHIICREFGTGKSSLIKKVSKEIGSGIIYVDVPPYIKDFGKAFGRALNFRFEENITFSKQLIRKIGCAETQQTSSCNFDNANRLTHMNKEILEVLQDDAKDSADSHSYIVVFVISDLLFNLARSSWSQAKLPPMEIGEITKDESMLYLIEKRSIDEEIAKNLYELVGGRFIDLCKVADFISSGESFNDLKEQILLNVEVRLNLAYLNEGQKYHKPGKLAINAILSSKEISIKKFKNYFEHEEEVCTKVLSANVFAYHPSRGTVNQDKRYEKCYK